MNPILSLFDGQWTTADVIIATIIGIGLVVIIYHFIGWFFGSRERSDDHALGCIRTLGWGCWLPLTLILIITIVVLR